MIKNLIGKKNYVTISKRTFYDKKINIPEGKWIKCSNCNTIIYKDELENNNNICINCNYHFVISSKKRIEQILDENSFIEMFKDIKSINPLDFPDYDKKLEDNKNKSSLEEAVVTGYGLINSKKVCIAIMDSNFMMGSMGKVVGEKITYSIEKAIELKLPIIIFCASGGARMQEGIVSLMQMAKTSAAVKKLNKAGNLYISVLTDPTYGGVTASFASLGDIILAEPNAMIGFAGPRVIKQTIGEDLPEGFQTAEFLLEHGFVDKVVNRKEMKDTLYKLLLLNRHEYLK